MVPGAPPVCRVWRGRQDACSGYSVGMSKYTSKLSRKLRGRPKLPKRRVVSVGAVPGMSAAQLTERARTDTPAQKAVISVIDYGEGRCERRDGITDLEPVLAETRPEWLKTRWINLIGLQDSSALAALAEAYDLHPLAMEDVINAGQRPKAESYGSPVPDRPRFFIVSKMLHRDESGEVIHEQVSMFLGVRTVITIQEQSGDVWEPVRKRITNPASRFYTHGTGYLAYALLDAIIDGAFPILENYADQLELIEERIMTDPDPGIIHEVHRLKRELMLIRRELWPMRELIRSLLDQDTGLFDEPTRMYLRDVGDHAIAAIELVETYRELASGLGEAWMTAMSNRMNEVMKVLTIVASMFIPISFLAGVFGMNFESMPMLKTPAGFWIFAGACGALVVGMWWWFRRKGWL